MDGISYETFEDFKTAVFKHYQEVREKEKEITKNNIIIKILRCGIENKTTSLEIDEVISLIESLDEQEN